ncbi:hypothetical protein [Hyalangium rubrum]|uniref:Uncharacterized protein n=1 Tax=Hyalangium rubrum TaxID=3103134 RepID=A0ABU5HH07_9BACT|nr:hypothetical protein [Hyalangium sp. s54d21]MDY7232154.1 hypothetical protein [Hyalangium sp. s54d21]
MRHATRWILVSVAGGLVAVVAWAKTPRKPSAQEPPELRLRAREVVVYGWHKGGVEAFLVDEAAALHVVLPEAKGCQPEYRASVAGDTGVTLYRMKDVRNFLPWGGAAPPIPETSPLEKATSGTLVCTAIEGKEGKPAVRITLKELRFTSGRLRELGPVEAPLGVRPP